MTTPHKMPIEEFGEKLIATEDLDPLYVGLAEARLPRDQLYRWLLAYLCFYHAGAASFISEWEGTDYWHFMKAAAHNKYAPRDPALHWASSVIPDFTRWPRGAERRHFRGVKCSRAMDWLAERYRQPENAIYSLSGLSLEDTRRAIQAWPLFGPWISFKTVDLLERVARWPLSIPEDLVLIYDEPRAALTLLHQQNGLSSEENFQRVTAYFSKWKAPPTYDRPCGAAESETVLCKWKSYYGGHYYLGKDIREQREGLHGWGGTASLLLANYPEEVRNDYGVMLL